MDRDTLDATRQLSRTPQAEKKWSEMSSVRHSPVCQSCASVWTGLNLGSLCGGSAWTDKSKNNGGQDELQSNAKKEEKPYVELVRTDGLPVED